MSRLNLNLPEPKHAIQRAIIDFTKQHSLCREMWIACGTKTGKTFGGALSNILHLGNKRQCVNRWFAPIYAQSRIGFKYCNRFLPKANKNNINKIYKIKNSPQPTIEMVPNDSMLEFWHASDPESIEGEATYLNTLDEAAKYARGNDVYTSIKTTTTQTLGKILALSTPLGANNWFGVKWRKARDEMEWCLKKGKPLTQIALRAPTYINPTVNPLVYSEMKKNMPDRLYRQFVLAEFLEDGGVFTNILYCTDYDCHVLSLEDNEAFWIHHDSSLKKQVVIGVDWGKRSDYTIFTAISCVSDTAIVVGVQKFRKTKYTDAVTKHLKDFYNCFDNVVEAYHDATGVGDAVDDIIDGSGLEVEGKIFTNENKRKWALDLILCFQDKKIIVPDWYDMRQELDAYTMSFTQTGKIKFEADESSGTHDDIVSSLMLSYAAFCRDDIKHEVYGINTENNIDFYTDEALFFDEID